MTRNIFEIWWEKEQGRFHCEHFDTKEIAYAAWLANKKHIQKFKVKDITTIKTKIKKLKKQTIFYKEELRRICAHKNIIDTNDLYYAQYNEYVFRCKDCGMEFVTDDPNFILNN